MAVPYVPHPFHGNPKAYLWSELNRIAAALGAGGITSLAPANSAVVLTPNPITTTGTIGVSAKLNAYNGGDTPSAFTLGIVDSVDAAAWRTAIGAGTSTVVPAALTKTDDTNVTLTLGGTPATALLQASSVTVGWTGTLAKARGGFGLDASTLTGYVKAAGAGAITASATIPYSDLTGTPTIPVGANPTGTVGLAAVNGSAATFLRSDGAPALSQAIAPTWSGVHRFEGARPAFGASANSFVGIGQISGYPEQIFFAAAAATNEKYWKFQSGNAGGAGNGYFRIYLNNDAESTEATAFRVDRTAAAITSQTYGNATDLPAHNFYGQLSATATGPQISAYASGTGYVSLKLSRATGTASTWEAYIPSGSTDLRLFNSSDLFVFTSDGRLYGTALHNNANAVTGTATQYIASGTYTPTATNVANTSARSASVAQWMRVGNVVTVSGEATMTTSGAGTTRISLSLPIASNFANTFEAAGALSGQTTLTVVGGDVSANATNDNVELQFTSTGATTLTVSYHYTYLII